MNKSLLLSLPVIAMIMTSCGDSGNSSGKDSSSGKSVTKEMSADEGEVNPMAEFKFHKMIANLPSPMETFQILSATEVDMSPVMLTPTDKADKLSTMSQKAFGYGIYITDMGFLAYEESNQETLNYLRTCRNLAAQLGAGEVFDLNIAQKYKSDEVDREEFIHIMEEGYKAIDDYMQDNERFLNATEIFVGSWVESQLIATRMLKGTEMSEKNQGIYEGIFEQKMHASNLMNVLGEIDSDIEPEVYGAVEDLMMFYAGFGKPESLSQEDLVELESKLIQLKETLIG